MPMQSILCRRGRDGTEITLTCEGDEDAARDYAEAWCLMPDNFGFKVVSVEPYNGPIDGDISKYYAERFSKGASQ